MTKYVLHGGNTSDVSPDNVSFFHEITKGYTDEITILLVYFARKEEDLSPLIEQDRTSFTNTSTNKKLHFEIASAENFQEQVRNTDVIYLRGGNTAKLKEKLLSIATNYKSLFTSKTIAGSSAGCYVLTKYFWNNTIKDWEEGLGLVTVKAICHYEDTDEKIIRNFQDSDDSVSLLVLPEHKWQIFYS